MAAGHAKDDLWTRSSATWLLGPGQMSSRTCGLRSTVKLPTVELAVGQPSCCDTSLTVSPVHTEPAQRLLEPRGNRCRTITADTSFITTVPG